MLSYINRATILGNAVDEPVVREFGNGGKVANVTVVTNELSRNTQTGGWDEVPEFHRVVGWGRVAEEIAQYIHKGSRVYVDGRVKTHSYTDNTGVKRRTTEIVANEIGFYDSRSPSYGSNSGPSYGSNSGRSNSNQFQSQGGFQNEPASPWDNQPQQWPNSAPTRSQPSQSPAPSDDTDDEEIPF